MKATNEVNTRTAHRESEIGGLIKSQEEWGHTRYQDPNSWELRSGSWKRKNASGARQPWGDSQRGNNQQKLGFGGYADRNYGCGLEYNAVYAKYLISGEDDVQCPSKKKFAEWIQRRDDV